MRLWSSLIFLFCYINFGYGQSNKYPKWFSHQGQLEAESAIVGFSHVSFYPDSAAYRTIKDAHKRYALYRHCSVSGSAASIYSDYGSRSLGGQFFVTFDSTLALLAEERLIPSDTLHSASFTAVLLLDKQEALTNDWKLCADFSQKPSWIEKPPVNDNVFYAIGVSDKNYYEFTSWIKAEQNALLELAKIKKTDVKVYTKNSSYYQTIYDESYSGNLQQVKILARWIDPKNDIFYVLASSQK